MPHHHSTEFPEPTYREAVEGWQDCQAQLAEVREENEQLKILAAVIREEAGEQEERADQAEARVERLEGGIARLRRDHRRAHACTLCDKRLAALEDKP